jgi:hypothetical protein
MSIIRGSWILGVEVSRREVEVEVGDGKRWGA